MSIQSDWNIIKQRLPQEIACVETEFVCADKLVSFLIHAEDHRYKKHCGFDIIAIFRAIYKNLFYNSREGGSTIEQQLVRVLIADYEHSLWRKIGFATNNKYSYMN